MTINSKSYLRYIIFSSFGILIAIFWIIIFTKFIIIGDNFEITHLVLLPVLIIPSWLIFICQHFLNRYKFNNNGIIINKIIFLNLKILIGNILIIFSLQLRVGNMEVVT